MVSARVKSARGSEEKELGYYRALRVFLGDQSTRLAKGCTFVLHLAIAF